jgi:LPS sulfotransferase NodH
LGSAAVAADAPVQRRALPAAAGVTLELAPLITAPGTPPHGEIHRRKDDSPHVVIPQASSLENVIARSKKAIDRIFNGIRYQARYRGGSAGSPAHRPRFLIFSRGRSGSSLLVDLLNQLPEVHCDGELLHYRVPFPHLFVRGCQFLAPSQAYGFKLLTYQLPGIRRGAVRVVSPPKPVKTLSDVGPYFQRLNKAGYQVIYLKRSNLLRQVISPMYAGQMGQWHRRAADGNALAAPVKLDVNEIYYRLIEAERLALYEESALSGLNVLELIYERDLQGPDAHQRTVDRVARYLGVSSAPVEAGFARIIGDDLAAHISNYDEVMHFIAKTPYGRFLSPEGTL